MARTLVKSIADVERELIPAIQRSAVVSYDYETYETASSYINLHSDRRPIDFFCTRIAGCGYGTDDGEFYVSIGHASSANLPVTVLNRINSFLPITVCHNLGFEYKVSKINNIFFPIERAHDTMLMAHKYSNELPMSLKALAEVMFNFTYEDKALAKKVKMDEVTAEQVFTYACNDVEYTRKLYFELMSRLPEDLFDMYREIELPMVKVLADMELRGVRVDLSRSQAQYHTCLQKISDLEIEIYSAIGKTINLDSSKQLGQVLFEDLGLPKPKMTAKGGASVDKEVLRSLANMHPVVEQLLRRKKMVTVNNLFYAKFPQLVNRYTGRMHPEFRLAATDTGRLSGSNPNMQQLRKTGEKDAEEMNVRSVFIPDSEDERIVSIDFAGMELRLCAILTQDPVMLNAFKNDMDLHDETCKGIFGEVTKDKRKIAKIMNFAILYGSSAGGLKKLVSRKDALDAIPAQMVEYALTTRDPHQVAMDYLLKRWYDTYPMVRQSQRITEYTTYQNHEARDLFGNRRTFWRVDWGQDYDRYAASRQAFNFRIQGSNAAMTKLVMLDIAEKLPEVKMIASVHDEVVASVPVKGLVELVREMHQLFIDWDFPIPIYSSVGVGKSYGELVEYQLPNGNADFEKLRRDYE
jgi:DNA polymerase-1